MTQRKKAPKSVLVEETPVQEVVEETHEDILSSTHNVVNLPSNGAFGYPDFVQYRDIMVQDEEVLASASPETYAITLNGVIKNVLNDPEWFEQMTIPDRDFVLVWLWANNYTKVKQVNVTCPNCGHEEINKVDLTELPSKPLSEKLVHNLEIPIKKTGNKIKVRLNTVGDEIACEKFQMSNKEYTYDYLMRVASIDIGVPLKLQDKVKWVKENVSAKEMGYVRQYHQYFSYGLKSTIEHKCTQCGEVTAGDIPFSTADILVPSVMADDFEALL